MLGLFDGVASCFEFALILLLHLGVGGMVCSGLASLLIFLDAGFFGVWIIDLMFISKGVSVMATSRAGLFCEQLSSLNLRKANVCGWET